MWGYNPHATARVYFKGGGYEYREGYTATGCGYDKESTVIAQIFNDFLKYKLYKKYIEEKPYGITIGRNDKYAERYYDGGVGISCYYKISEYIGGQFINRASGKTYDSYEYINKRKRKRKE